MEGKKYVHKLRTKERTKQNVVNEIGRKKRMDIRVLQTAADIQNWSTVISYCFYVEALRLLILSSKINTTLNIKDSAVTSVYVTKR
jgi:hypothetical protein